MRYVIPLPVLALVALLASGEVAADPPAVASATSSAESTPEIVYAPLLAALEAGVEVTPLVERFPTPTGYRRVPLADGSFGAYLRHLPVRRDRTRVRAHHGGFIPAPAAGVVAWDVGERDLQQCADAAIRLHAEWLWSAERADEAAYRFTSGDRTTWRDWRAGEVLRVRGREVVRSTGPARPDSHASYRRWLDQVFTYAGTRSLPRDTVSVEPSRARPGDLALDPGSPGHVVVLLDMAVGPKGDRLALIGQSFMPAQEFHIVQGHGSHTVDRVWFRLPPQVERLDTPSWRPFRGDQFRRWRLP